MTFSIWHVPKSPSLINQNIRTSHPLTLLNGPVLLQLEHIEAKNEERETTFLKTESMEWSPLLLLFAAEPLFFLHDQPDGYHDLIYDTTEMFASN